MVSHGHNHNDVEGVVAGGAEHGCWVRIHFAKVMFVHVHGNFCVFLLFADFPNQKDFLPFEMPEDLLVVVAFIWPPPPSSWYVMWFSLSFVCHNKIQLVCIHVVHSWLVGLGHQQIYQAVSDLNAEWTKLDWQPATAAYSFNCQDMQFHWNLTKNLCKSLDYN